MIKQSSWGYLNCLKQQQHEENEQFNDEPYRGENDHMFNP